MKFTTLINQHWLREGYLNAYLADLITRLNKGNYYRIFSKLPDDLREK